MKEPTDEKIKCRKKIIKASMIMLLVSFILLAVFDVIAFILDWNIVDNISRVFFIILAGIWIISIVAVIYIDSLIINKIWKHMKKKSMLRHKCLGIFLITWTVLIGILVYGIINLCIFLMIMHAV